MRPLHRTTLLPLVLLVSAEGSAAQTVPPIQARALRHEGAGQACRDRLHATHPLVEEVSRILPARSRPPDAEAALDALEGRARREVEAAPSDTEARYRLAVVLGARADLTEGRRSLPLAEELYREARRVLAADPAHPGAHHLLGRLHAAVMRIGGLERFLARHVLGSDVLGSASWDRARYHLETAEAGDRCVPDHHYELARLYVERGELRRGWTEIGHVLALTAHDRRRWAGVRRKAEALARRDGVSRVAAHGPSSR